MSKIYNFFVLNTPPSTDHQLNFCETIGNSFLSPIAHAGGTLAIKTKTGESLLLRKIFAVALVILTLPLSIIGALLKGVGQAWPHKKIAATDETATISLTSQQRVNECYAQIEIFQRVCIENGFVGDKGVPKFMICWGTALGAERHKGMIPWDDDVDIALFDETGFLALKDKLKEAGLEMNDSTRFNSLYKFKFTQEKFKELYPRAHYSDSAELDVFIWSKMSDGSYTYDTSYARSNWPSDYITAEEFEQGFEPKQFGPLQLPGIKSQAAYVQRTYGDNCLTHGIETHGHAKICGIVLPFAKFGAHYFKIEKYKECARPN